MGLPRKLLHGRTNLAFRTNRWLIGILCCALAIRVVLAIGVQYQLDHRWQRDFVIEGDANGYWELAQTIVAGDDYAIYTPPRYVLRMPGYPAFLATSMFLFGESHFAARILTAMMGTLGCGLVYLLSKCFFNETTSLIAAGWAAVSPTLAGFSVILLSETLFAVTLLFSLLAFVKLNGVATWASDSSKKTSQGSSRYLWSTITGLAIAAACYVRPSWILIALAFALIYIWLNRQRVVFAIVPAILIFVGLGAALTPWAIRNDRVTGHFIATTLWMGPSLYDGLNPKATGDSDMTFYDEDRMLLQKMTEYEVNSYYRNKALQYAADNPGRSLQLVFFKQLRYWNPLPNAEQFRHWSMILLLAPLTLLFYGASIYGIYRLGWNPVALLVLVFPILYFAAIHSFFVSSLRYRLPAEYALLPVAAFGITQFWQTSKKDLTTTQPS